MYITAYEWKSMQYHVAIIQYSPRNISYVYISAQYAMHMIIVYELHALSTACVLP